MIGREKESSELLRLYHGRKAELVAVYGRRRIGKTYLVDETLRGKIRFRHAGLSPAEGGGKGMLKAQLEHFYYSLLLQGMRRSHRPGSWLEAFFMLESFLDAEDDGGRQVVFLDELPWMDTPRSGFITAFEGFWNNWGCHRERLMLVVCGSANSWVLDKLLNSHGGLYNRVTYEIKLSPFTLRECEAFLRAANVRLSRYDIAQCYMITGGIPYYLGYFESGLSLAQNIDRMFFGGQAKLRDEYDRLFASVFSSPDAMKAIAGLLHTRNAGYTRKEIADRLGMADGGTLSQNLGALLASDFAIRYVPFGRGRHEAHYKLADPFCRFYLHFLNGRKDPGAHFWQGGQSSQDIVSWRGFAFENVCFNHIPQIKAALGISGVRTRHSAWVNRDGGSDGAQVDLLIERDDNVLNVCEIKFYSDAFSVSKAYYRLLLRRLEQVSQASSPKTAVRHTLITSFGLKHNEYSGIFSNVVTLDDLFA